MPLFTYKYFILSMSHFGIWLNSVGTFLVWNLELIFNVPQATFLYNKHIFMIYPTLYFISLKTEHLSLAILFLQYNVFSNIFLFPNSFLTKNFDLNTLTQNTLGPVSITNYVFRSILGSQICFKNRFKNLMAGYIAGLCRHFLLLWVFRHFLSSRKYNYFPYCFTTFM